MRKILPSVPHFRQSVDGACLPACARMLTAFWGNSHSEAELAKILGTKRSGTPIYNSKYLEKLGYKVIVTPLTEETIKSYLADNQPIIARVWMAMLDLGAPSASHVVVVVGYDEQFVYLNDPAHPAAARPVIWDAFLAAWAEYDEMSIIITKG